MVSQALFNEKKEYLNWWPCIFALGVRAVSGIYFIWDFCISFFSSFHDTSLTCWPNLIFFLELFLLIEGAFVSSYVTRIPQSSCNSHLLEFLEHWNADSIVISYLKKISISYFAQNEKQNIHLWWILGIMASIPILELRHPELKSIVSFYLK